MKKNLKSEMQSLRSIGVFGLHPDAGTTFVSLLCAEYIHCLRGYKTAVTECKEHSDLCCMIQNPALKKREESERYTLHGITLLSLKESKTYTDCLNKTDSCVIYDLGCCYFTAKDLLEHCDIILLVFRLCDWRFTIHQLEKELNLLFSHGRPEHAKYCILGNMISDKDKKCLQKTGYPVNYLGFEPNVYVPSQDARYLFDTILRKTPGMGRD